MTCQEEIDKVIQSSVQSMEDKNLKYERFYIVFIWSIVAGFTALYISLVFNHNIWTDEAFTLQLLQGNVKDIIMGTAKDVHPPLYYLYAKLFMVIFGDSLLVQKVAAIIPMTATLAIGATLIRKNFGNRVSLLFLLFLACIPCTMEFSVQVRMYSMALFFVTLCGIYAYQAFVSGDRKDFLIFALSGVMAAYTHYFAFVSVIIIAGLLFISILLWEKKRIVMWMMSAIGMIAGYLPWIPFFFRQVASVEQGYWIPEITAQTIWEYFLWTFELELVPGMVFLFLILLKGASLYNIITIAKYKDKTEIYALLCMLVPTLTTVLGVVVSEFKTPVYRDQYIMPALGMLALFFGIAVGKAKRWLVIMISMFLLFVGAVQYRECFRQEYHSTYVPQTEEFFADNLENGDYVIYNWESFGFIYECYFNEEQLVYCEEFDFSKDFNTVWFLHTEWQPEIPQEVVEENGLIIENMGHYGIEHNEFDIYKIYKATRR